MAAVRSSSTNSATTGTAVSVAAPAGTTTGDVVVVIVHANAGTTTCVDNNGATPFTEDYDAGYGGGGGHAIAIYSRRIVADDPTTYNFTISASGRWSAIAVAFQDPNPTTIYDVAPAAGTVNSLQDTANGTITAPSINTLTDNAIHIAASMMDSATATISTTPDGYTNQQTATNQPQVFTYKLITSAGATGAQSFTWDTATGRLGVSFAIKAAAAGSASPSVSPSVSPSASPSASPSVSPSVSPSASPSLSPSLSPSQSPSVSISPSISSSVSPSASPSISPSASPSAAFNWEDGNINSTDWSESTKQSTDWAEGSINSPNWGSNVTISNNWTDESTNSTEWEDE